MNHPIVINKTTLLFAAIFLGTIGYDRYLLGNKYWWVKAITLGGLGIWIAYDIYRIIINKPVATNDIF